MKQLQRGLFEALALHRPAHVDPRLHIREGRRSEIEWESEVPVTDSRARGVRAP